MTTSAAQPRTTASGGPRPPAGTVSRLFLDAVERFDRPDALQAKVDGVYRPISHRTLLERVRRVGRGLRALGIERGDRVAILSENRPEWAIADYGCIMAGITDVPLYPSLPAQQAAYVIRDSEAVAIFVSTEAQARKVAEVRGELPAIAHVIGFGAERWAGVDLTLAELEARGASGETADSVARWRAEALASQSDDILTLIYTSGTTGEPKGVMLTHDNLYSNVQACSNVIPLADAVTLSFLPLSHVLQRMVDYWMFGNGASIAYAESMETVAANLMEVRPTIVVSVPRLYEKMYAGVLEKALSGGPVKKSLFFWARGVALRWANAILAGRKPSRLTSIGNALARRLVFSKLHQRTGGRLRYFVSGGAPLAPDINRFFYAAGLTILEGYGLTETSPVIAVNTPADFRIGTVGKPIPGVEVMIAPDGEILTRGPHVMKGYFKKPDATREVIDSDGWLHTGDIGQLEEGFLRITDRKKDIIVTAGGKNIAPQPIENQIKTNKYVTQAVMLGDKRRFPVVLVVPNFEQLERWARLKNLRWGDRQQLVDLPLVRAKMDKEVLGKLSGLASFETPKKVGLLTEDFTLGRGEMTPTLKVKRRVIEDRYRAIIDALYVDGDANLP